MGPFAAIEFSEFIRHFRKLDDAAIAIDIRQSMDDLEELTADGESLGALMVRKMNSRISQNRERNRINGSKGGRPRKKLTNDPCLGESAKIPNAQQSHKTAVPGTPAEVAECLPATGLDITTVYNFAEEWCLDEIDCREWWEMTVRDRDGCDRDGNPILNWKGALKRYCAAKARRRAGE